MDYRQNELSHHGILGMKWGIRRFQNKDGSLTSKGKTRQETNNKNIIQKHKDKLISKYIEKGYSQSAAEVAAKQRMRTELIFGTIGVVAVSLIAKKAITRIGQDYCDKVIKSGKVIQNIHAADSIVDGIANHVEGFMNASRNQIPSRD